MRADDLARAVVAARTVVVEAGLTVDEVVVLRDSNRVTLRLLPADVVTSDVVASVAPSTYATASFEVALAVRLAERGSVAVEPDPRVPAQVHRRDGFLVTIWTAYDTVPGPVAPQAYADALLRLHADLRAIDLPTPHVDARIASARAIVAEPARSPGLADVDRAMVLASLDRAEGVIAGGAEQLVHGEPHPGNVLATTDGLRFIDLETGCRGPVELDLAHLSGAVAERYPGVDPVVLAACRELVLALVASWRADRDDDLPGGRRDLDLLLTALGAGPPWPDLVDVLPP